MFALLIPLVVVAGGTAVAAQEQVDPLTGRLRARVTDFVLHAGPIEIAVERALQTRDNAVGPLGARWRLNWGARLTARGSALLLEELSGNTVFIAQPGRGEYRAVTGERIVVAGQRRVRQRLDGTTESFDDNGRLVERVDGRGNALVVRYGPSGALSAIAGAKGAQLAFDTDQRGRVTRIVASTGAIVRYAYDNDRLVSVQVNQRAPVRYAYDAKGQLVSIEGPLAGPVRLAYDGRGRVVSRRWADGAQERFEYDDRRLEQRRIDPTGAVTIVRWIVPARAVQIVDPGGHSVAIAFDAAGRPLAVGDPQGRVARLGYDAAGRLVEVSDSKGRAGRLDYLGETTRIASITRADGTRETIRYDERNRPIEVKSGEQTMARLSYAADGSVAVFKLPGEPVRALGYDPQGRLRTLTNEIGDRYELEHDDRGNLVRARSPLGGLWAWQWDAQDRLVAKTDPAGATVRYEYDGAGRVAARIDPLGAETRYQYDARGRVIAETGPAGQATRYEYDPAGRLVALQRAGAVERLRYDAAGRLVHAVDGLGRSMQLLRDADGALIALRASGGLTLLYRYDRNGELVAVQDSTGANVQWQRDSGGRVIERRDALGQAVRYEYDALGMLTAVRDALGNVKRFEYTTDGELARVHEPNGDASGYRYDAARRLVEIERGSGGRERYQYNRAGQLIRQIDPLGNERRFEYDVAGRLQASTDALGRTTRYAYDAAGRLTEKRSADGVRIAFRYDVGGRLLEADDGVFPVRYGYDAAGRRVKVEYPAIRQSIAYEYDAAGLKTRMSTSGGRVTRYEYDANKRLAGIVMPDGGRIAFDYDPRDRLTRIAYPNATTGAWSFDAAGRIAAVGWIAASGKPFAAWTYRYGLDGNLDAEQDAEGREIAYRHDPAGQLVEVRSDSDRIGYRYGPGGARVATELRDGRIAYAYDAADRLVSAGPQTLSYDANGNVIAREAGGATTRYEYDADGRLVRLRRGDGSVTSYGYAPTGERVWARDGDGEPTYFVYDGIELIEVLDAGGRLKTAYVHGPGVDQPLAMLRDGRTYHLHADRLGSVRAVTDASSAIAASFDYDAFGNPQRSRGELDVLFRFGGREWDLRSGLYYLRARHYDPVLGRFLSPDLRAAPLDQPRDHNPYLYVRNQPLRFVDPSGLAPAPPLQEMSLDQLIAEKARLNDLGWRSIRAGLRVIENVAEIEVRNFTPTERLTLERLHQLTSQHQAAEAAIKAELSRRGYVPPPRPEPPLTAADRRWLLNHGYDPDVPTGPGGTASAAAEGGTAGPRTRPPTQKVTPVGGAHGAAPRQPTIKVAPHPDVEPPVGAGGSGAAGESVAAKPGGAGGGRSNPLSGELKAAGIATLIAIGVYILDSDDPVETTKGLLPDVIRSTAIGSLFGPGGLLVDQLIQGGRGLIDFVDEVVKQGAIPPPPQLLPDRDNPTIPPWLLPLLPNQPESGPDQSPSGPGGPLVLPGDRPSGDSSQPPSGVVTIRLCPGRDDAGNVVMRPCLPGERPPPQAGVDGGYDPTKDPAGGRPQGPVGGGVGGAGAAGEGFAGGLGGAGAGGSSGSGGAPIGQGPYAGGGQGAGGSRGGTGAGTTGSSGIGGFPGAMPGGVACWSDQLQTWYYAPSYPCPPARTSPRGKPPTWDTLKPPPPRTPPIAQGPGGATGGGTGGSAAGSGPGSAMTPGGGSGPSGGSGPLVQGGQGVVPPAGGTTGPACDPPICREMQVRNCESLGTAIGNCMQAGAGLPSCGRSKFTLAEVKAACYDNMVRRCQQGTSQVAQKLTPGNWCAQRGADPSCEVRAQRVCGCNPKTHPACRGKWEE